MICGDITTTLYLALALAVKIVLLRRQLQIRLGIGNSSRHILLEAFSGGAGAYEDELLVRSPSKRRKGCDAGARPSVRPCDARRGLQEGQWRRHRATGLFHGHGRGRVARPEPSPSKHVRYSKINTRLIEIEQYIACVNISWC